jgi:hypothetical protein
VVYEVSQTLLDWSVRDAWEIGKRRMKIDSRRWLHALGPERLRSARRVGVGDHYRKDFAKSIPADNQYRKQAQHPERAREIATAEKG